MAEDFIPCSVCGEPKTQVKVEYICDKESCFKIMRERHAMIFLPSAPMTRVKMFKKDYSSKMTSNWKEIADATGFNYDGTMKV